MNFLLIFFALPVATILISIVLEKILRSPVLVAMFTFAVYLIVTFAAFDINFLIQAIMYTILAFITAATFELLLRVIKNNEDRNFNCRNITENDTMNNRRAKNTFNNNNIISTEVDANTNMNADMRSLEEVLNNRRRRRI